MLPEGKYKAQAIECVFNQSDDGKPQAIIRFVIVGGEQDGETITSYRYFTAAAAERAIRDMATIGARMEGGDVTDIEGIGIDVQIVVEHEEYQGKVRPKVSGSTSSVARSSRGWTRTQSAPLPMRCADRCSRSSRPTRRPYGQLRPPRRPRRSTVRRLPRPGPP